MGTPLVYHLAGRNRVIRELHGHDYKSPMGDPETDFHMAHSGTADGGLDLGRSFSDCGMQFQ
jgi:hypothetical protein